MAVHRKARVTDVFRTDTHNIEGPREHLIYLKWGRLEGRCELPAAV